MFYGNSAEDKINVSGKEVKYLSTAPSEDRSLTYCTFLLSRHLTWRPICQLSPFIVSNDTANFPKNFATGFNSTLTRKQFHLKKISFQLITLPQTSEQILYLYLREGNQMKELPSELQSKDTSPDSQCLNHSLPHFPHA